MASDVERLQRATVYAILGARIDAAMMAQNQMAFAVQVEAAKAEGATDTYKKAVATAMKGSLAACREVYLNAIDALCTALINDEVSRDRVEADYGKSLIALASDYADDLERYPNIVAVIDSMQEE